MSNNSQPLVNFNRSFPRNFAEAKETIFEIVYFCYTEPNQAFRILWTLISTTFTILNNKSPTEDITNETIDVSSKTMDYAVNAVNQCVAENAVSYISLTDEKNTDAASGVEFTKSVTATNASEPQIDS